MTVHFELDSTRSGQVSYDQVVQELYKLGVAGLPPFDRRRPDRSWHTPTEQFSVLKTIEFLVSRRKRILADAARVSENRVDPLSSQTKNHQRTVEMLTEQNAALDQEIAEVQQRLEACKAQREQQKQVQAKELKDRDERIAALTTESRKVTVKQ
jgi:regulator of replication initiation timing